jgi:lactoylglutathione lyase
MSFNGFHHVGLIVDDAERSLKFYIEGLGGTIVHTFPMGASGKTITLVDIGGNAVVEIIPRGNEGEQANARFAHIAVNTDDVQAAYDLALAAGATTASKPDVGFLGTMKKDNCFVLGPDGESIEFFNVLSNS